jgi:hypothetical protein
MKNKLFLIFFIGLAGFLSACNKVLNITPPSAISPEEYFTDESQLAAYAINLYGSVFPQNGAYSFGIFGIDAGTDNMAANTYSVKYVPGQYKVGQDGGDWEFSEIYQCNYFFDHVKGKTITGSQTNINQYIGEMYAIRAYVYFGKLQSLGDFPILTTTLPDNAGILTDSSKRMPSNEVARFIIRDLDSAISLMQPISPDGHKQRLSKYVALLLKSRVALYEATWLKYFKGTAFVPNGPNWPGATKGYNANYQYPSGSIDNEINYFLDEAIDASKQVADNFPLTPNTMTNQSQSPTGIDFSQASDANPYCQMYSAVDLSPFSEVLLWRQYSKGLNITHNVDVYAQGGNDADGTTRGMVDGFLMKNGLPIYAPGSGYAGDDSISLVRQNRDGRLWLFLKEPGQINVLYPNPIGANATPIEPYPRILVSTVEQKYNTGYTIRKGLNYDQTQCLNGGCYTGALIFRATEAYLNYIEAYYERNGSLDGTAQSYWQQIRNRAGVDPDFNKTIAATDVSKEAANDWGAYSAGNLIDPTLYSIRRERRCELWAEGLRWMDLERWRAMDQMITTPYHIEGFKLWGPMQYWYAPGTLIYGANNATSNVSDPSLSPYLRPYEISSQSLVYNGYRWAMAHYLSPIAMHHFLITASDGQDVTTSPIYQNPGWPIAANEGAIY